MLNLSVARRYARALIEVAAESGAVEKIGEQLDALVQIMRSSPELENAGVAVEIAADDVGEAADNAVTSAFSGSNGGRALSRGRGRRERIAERRGNRARACKAIG